MNNKPVAWTTKKPKTVQDFSFYKTKIYTEPLYTHPVKELTPCEELRAFQEQQNKVFSDHNACCYRHECRIVWNDWEKIISNPAELTDKDEVNLIKDAEQFGHSEVYITGLIDGFNHARAILRKEQAK